MLAAGRTADDPAGPPYSPADSMRTMELEQGFRLELVVSEPDVQSPVAMEIDEDGRLFVVEMPGYPLDVSPSGKVKLLEDRDGDGRFERVSVFADGLVLPTGVMRWKKGVLVTAAPDVIYFEDTDGDGRADVRTVVLTGLRAQQPAAHGQLADLRSRQLGVRGAPGPGGRGDLQGALRRSRQAADVSRTRRTGRLWIRRTAPSGSGRTRSRPKPIGGESQYGHTFDAYGRYFGNDNSHHLWHEVIGARYLQRNPHLLVPRVMHDVPDHGAAAQVFPITKRPNFELLTEAGEFTSACAPTMYLGGAFGGDA